MKSNFFIYITLVFLVIPQFSFSQSDDTSRHIKAELEGLIMKLDSCQSKITEEEFTQLINRYNEIANGINGWYRVAAIKISNGFFLVRGDNVKKRYTSIAEGIAYYEKLADQLYVEIQRTIDMANGKKPSVRATAFWKEGLSIALLVKMIYDFVKDTTCVNASYFYEEARWFTFSELKKGSASINWNLILGVDCAKAIQKANEQRK